VLVTRTMRGTLVTVGDWACAGVAAMAKT